MRAQRASKPPGPPGTRVAAIDCGTNTIKLFIGSPPHAEVRETRMVRLGEGVDTTGVLSAAALARTFAAIDEYAALLATRPVARLRFCATSATRDASNAAVFRKGVRARLGVEPEVLSGDEEAALGFAGAMSGLTDDVAGPVLVLDVGGGSTEVILGHRDGGVLSARSMDVGSVRLHERHVRHDPPTDEELTKIARDVDAALDGCGVPLAEAATVVGIAGTCTTLAAAVLDLGAYLPDEIHGSVHEIGDVRDASHMVVSRTVERRRELPYMHPGRADVIDAGFVIVERVLARTRVDRFRVCETDILDGIAWSLT